MARPVIPWRGREWEVEDRRPLLPLPLSHSVAVVLHDTELPLTRMLYHSETERLAEVDSLLEGQRQ